MTDDSLYLLTIAELAALAVVSIIAFFYVLRKLKKVKQELLDLKSKGVLMAQNDVAAPSAALSLQDSKETTENTIFKQGVKPFLSSQSSLSKDRRDDCPTTDALASRVYALRHNYLKLEYGALKHAVNSEAYWHYIYKNISNLMRLMTKCAVDGEHSNKELENQITLLRERIKHLLEKEEQPTELSALAALDQTLIDIGNTAENVNASDTDTVDKLLKANIILSRVTEDHDFSDVQENCFMSLDIAQEGQAYRSAKLQSLLEEQAEKIAQLTQSLGLAEGESLQGVKENKALSRSLKIAENHASDLTLQVESLHQRLEGNYKKIDDVKGRQENSSGSFTLLERTSEMDQQCVIFDDVVSDVESLKVNEIGKLRETISGQRLTIVELEHELLELNDSLGGDDASNKPIIKEINHLKRVIQESEGCIQILESEVDYLKGQLDVLQETLEPKTSSGVSLDDIQTLSESLMQTQSQLSKKVMESGRDRRIMHFFEACIEVSSIEDFALVLMDFLQQYGSGLSICIDVNGKSVEVSDKGKVSVEERAKLKSMAPEQVDNHQLPVALLINFKHIAAIFHGVPGSDSLSDNEAEIVDVMRYSSFLLHKVGFQQDARNKLKNYEYFANVVRKTSKESMAYYSYQSKEAQEIVNSVVNQITAISQTLNMSDSFKNSLKDVEEEANIRLDIMNKNRGIMAKKFDQLVERLNYLK